MPEKIKISFIGAGNVATHLAKELHSKGYQIAQIFSRTIDPAMELAKATKANWTTSINDIETNSVIIFSVTDDVLKDLLAQRNWNNALLLHTSGSIDMNIFSGHSENFGVLYPLQTFSKKRAVNFDVIPICIEANTKNNLEIIQNLASSISYKIHEVNSQKRKALHIAAVFACNFTNNMYAISETILKDNKLDFELLRPLILETAKKAVTSSPVNSQTGPAARNDKKVMQEHESWLEKYGYFQKLYRFVSESIIRIKEKRINNDEF